MRKGYLASCPLSPPASCLESELEGWRYSSHFATIREARKTARAHIPRDIGKYCISLEWSPT